VGLVVLDSSVLIAFLDADDAHHMSARTAIAGARSNHSLTVPIVAFSETLVGPYKKGPVAVRDFEVVINDLANIAPLTREIAHKAAALRTKHKVKLPDAIIIATGIEGDAAETLTFDDHWRGIDKRVRVLAGNLSPSP
jgi:predicted nucleic acid-binding protein